MLHTARRGVLHLAEQREYMIVEGEEHLRWQICGYILIQSSRRPETADELKQIFSLDFGDPAYVRRDQQL